jgi:hypothetical protein
VALIVTVTIAPMSALVSRYEAPVAPAIALQPPVATLQRSH